MIIACAWWYYFHYFKRFKFFCFGSSRKIIQPQNMFWRWSSTSIIVFWHLNKWEREGVCFTSETALRSDVAFGRIQLYHLHHFPILSLYIFSFFFVPLFLIQLLCWNMRIMSWTFDSLTVLLILTGCLTSWMSSLGLCPSLGRKVNHLPSTDLMWHKILNKCNKQTLYFSCSRSDWDAGKCLEHLLQWWADHWWRDRW